MTRYDSRHIRKMRHELLEFIHIGGAWTDKSNGKLKRAFKSAMIDANVTIISNDRNNRIAWSNKIFQRINGAFIRGDYDKINQYYKEFMDEFGEDDK